MVIKEKVFILKKVNFSESDLILHGLNQTGAKVSVIARGAKKSIKRFGGGVLEPTHFVDWIYSKKENQELGVLKEAHLKCGFEKLRTDFKRLELAFYFLHLTSYVSFQGMPTSSSMFDLLGSALKQTEKTSNLLRLKTHFEIKFLFEQGVLSASEYAYFLRSSLEKHSEISLLDQKRRFISQAVFTYLDRKFDLHFVSLEN